MSYPICFVSLGPGDPELITLKGLKKLRQADIIYCPATISKSGQLLSRAARIIEELEIEKSVVQFFTLPMSKDRTEVWKVYDTLYEKAISARDKEKKVVIVAEGDAGFYSSIQYIYDKFKENRIEVERTAGIPAFIAAGALAGLHIVKQEEQIIVIPGMLTAEELSKKIKTGNVIVIMKLSQLWRPSIPASGCIRKRTSIILRMSGPEKSFTPPTGNKSRGKYSHTFPL